MDTRKYQCFVCGELFETFDLFKSHIYDNHDQGREWIKCPVQYCQCPCRDLRVHFKTKHPSLSIPKNCQIRAQVWFDHAKKKKKISFAEGYFVSKKNGGKSMHYRSGYELKVYKILESLAEVFQYFVEPCKIEYFFKGKQRNYIPDLIVLFTDGRKEMWEIKPASQISIPSIQAKKIAAENYCLHRGMQYKMITEGYIDSIHKKAKDQLL